MERKGLNLFQPEETIAAKNKFPQETTEGEGVQ